jgi:hypothetical protein
MQNAFLVHVGDRKKRLADREARRPDVEAAAFRNHFLQIAVRGKFGHVVEVLGVLEGQDEADDIVVAALGHNITFDFHIIHFFLADNVRLRENFHRVLRLIVLVSNFKNLAKGTLAEDVADDEIIATFLIGRGLWRLCGGGRRWWT